MLNSFKIVIFLILVLSSICIAEENKNMPGWIDPWRDNTVAIGQIQTVNLISEDGTNIQKQVFIIVGTGIILGLEDDKTNAPWLVTAKHVFYNPEQTPKWEPDNLQIRFTWFEDKPVDKYLGIRIDLKKDGQRLWIPHPNNDVDLACIPLHISKAEAGRDNLQMIPLLNYATADDIYEGAPILTLGYPGAVGPEFWTKAIVRQGIISWVSPTSPESNILLIDSNVFPGNSGGPVFRVPTGLTKDGGFTVGGRIAFLGIISQGPREAVPVTIGGEKIEVQDDKGNKANMTSLNYIGIGVVEPASRIKEMLIEATKLLKQDNANTK